MTEGEVTIKRLEPRKTVCLNMIVKNESHVIERCLRTVKPLIDYWVIVDTGSTDGTQKIIKNFMKDIPGELHERPWKNFEHNRNEALALAKNKADYILFMDADHTLEYDDDFVLPDLNKDLYLIAHDFRGNIFYKEQLVNSRLDWSWKGVLHEGLQCSQTPSKEILGRIKTKVSLKGHRSQNPKKFANDIRILQAALKKEPENARYQFYLAITFMN